MSDSIEKDKKMKYVDFYPRPFLAILNQDNPAFGNDECLMIVRESEPGSDHAVVLHIIPDPIESVTSAAKFWKHDLAIKYCQQECDEEDRLNEAKAEMRGEIIAYMRDCAENVACPIGEARTLNQAAENIERVF